MSISLMSAAWGLALTHPKQAVLMAMADHADDDGNKVFPSIERIAWKTGYSRRQVTRIVAGLHKDGLLVLVKPAGRYTATEWRIDLGAGKRKPPYASIHEIRGAILSSMPDLSTKQDKAGKSGV